MADSISQSAFITIIVTLVSQASAHYRIKTSGSCSSHGLTPLDSPGGYEVHQGNAQCPDTSTYYECDLARKQLHKTATMSLWCSSSAPLCWYASRENKFYYCAGASDFCSASRPCVCKEGALRSWPSAEPKPALGSGASPEMWAEGECPFSMGRNGYSAGNCEHKTLNKCKQQCASHPDCVGFSFHTEASTCGVYFTDASWKALVPGSRCWRKQPCFMSNKKYSPIDMIVEGRTLGRSVESSAAACQQRCALVSGCVHFSWWGDGGCHLQDAGSTVQASSGVIAGPPSCHEHCLESNKKYSPIDMIVEGRALNRTVESSASTCQQRCASVSGCVHFSWWGDGGCHLQGAGSSVQASSGVITGPPACQSSPTTRTTTTTVAVV